MSSISSVEEEDTYKERHVGNAFAGLMFDSDSDSKSVLDSNSEGDLDSIKNVDYDNLSKNSSNVNSCISSELEEESCIYKDEKQILRGISEFDNLAGQMTRHGTIIKTDYVDTIKQLIGGDRLSKPTNIQSELWTTLLSPLKRERDVIAISSTGSGKTLAFLVPLLSSLTAEKKQQPMIDNFIYPRAVILAPTRVLAQQILDVASFLVTNTPSLQNVKVSVVLGGAAYHQQIISLLETDPDVIIATPGRFNSLCGRVKDNTTPTMHDKVDMCIKLDEVCEIVIDEADMMLALGFEDDISWYAQLVNKNNAHGFRLVLTSATWEKETGSNLSQFKSISDQEPVFLMTDASQVVTRNVTQRVEVLSHKGAPRFKYLCKLLTAALQDDDGVASSSKIIVFCPHKSQTRQLGKDLRTKANIANVVLEGDMSQSARVAAIEAFCNGTQVLVATDIASRGLHVPNVSHVFNYSLGTSIESYIHRCGRTGRAGRFGVATTFVVKGIDEKLSPQLRSLLQEANQVITDDLRIMADKELKKRNRRLVVVPQDEDALELQEIRQANRQKQLRHNQKHHSKHNKYSKRRGTNHY